MFKAVASLMAAAALASSASGTIVYSTSFESPTFTAANINGQDGWAVSGFGVGANVCRILNAPTIAHSGSQLAYTDASGWTSAAASRWAYKVTSVTSASLLTAPVVRASVFVAMNDVAGTNRVSYGGLDLYDSVNARIGTIRIGSDGSVMLLNGASTVVQSAAGAIANPSTYHLLTITANFQTDSLDFLINGASIGGLPAGFATFSNADFGDADLNALRADPTTGTPAGGSQIVWDDLIVEQLPSPGAGALFAIAGVMGARRRRA